MLLVKGTNTEFWFQVDSFSSAWEDKMSELGMGVFCNQCIDHVADDVKV